jgi:hypothetical protein
MCDRGPRAEARGYRDAAALQPITTGRTTSKRVSQTLDLKDTHQLRPTRYSVAHLQFAAEQRRLDSLWLQPQVTIPNHDPSCGAATFCNMH